MKKTLAIISLFLAVFACTDNPVSQLEATDEEALFNVMLLDNFRLSEVSIFPDDIPDTAAFRANADSGQIIYWHDVDSTEETFNGNIGDEPIQTEFGMVYQAIPEYMITWYGAFYIMNYNDSADSIEIRQKSFALIGRREAICYKLGTTSQRRGWTLMEIGEASFGSSGGSYEFFDYLYYDTAFETDNVFNFNFKTYSNLPEFTASEQVTLRFDLPETTAGSIILIPDGTAYQEAVPQVNPDGGYMVTFNMPGIPNLKGQLKFLVLNANPAGTQYRATGFCYNYAVQ